MIESIVDYFAGCVDGMWEHANGISISTSDNPGWILTVDLKPTGQPVLFRYSRGDVPSSANGNLGKAPWIECEANSLRFRAACSLDMLAEVDAAFTRCRDLFQLTAIEKKA